MNLQKTAHAMASHAVDDDAAVPREHETTRVLLIHEDRTAADTFTSALSSLDVESSWAQSGREGLARARQTRFDLLFVDLDLPDIPGLAVISAVKAMDERARFVVVSATLTASLIRNAHEWGALGVMGKPFSENEVISVISRTFGSSRSPADDTSETMLLPPLRLGAPSMAPSRSGPRSVAERWAELILKTIYAEADPKTVGLWARLIGVSRSTLCEYCRLMHVSPHDARDFARFVRAIHRSGRNWQPETLLDLADRRTLKKLLDRAAVSGTCAKTPSIREFMDRQQWIPRNHPGLAILRALLLGEETSAAQPPS